MTFDGPKQLAHNEGLIADPVAFARKNGAASWLFLCGPAFAEMDGAGLHEGATAEQVLARAEAAGAPFTRSEDLRAWVVQGLAELG
jgi:hypothetical protein